ncbi:MAG: TetR/AcrR family transcriptional regulator [Actinobacteria bacterium]|nr:TetR/AcrR family transcriptional regulator [Actinomycetota bacterium]MDA3003112.1 TetR/AcrR family transcriptional regulator [Actinomycetota bacterium]
MNSRERGRPPMSSVAALEDAATELFLEQGYQNTSIDEIARRAGISRATFFNYCTTKSDVLWVDVDRALQSLDTLLGSATPLREALETVAAAHPRERIPLVASQSEAMGLGDELAASVGVRLERLRRSIAGSGVEQKDVWLVLGVIVEAVLSWARAPSPREELVALLEFQLQRIRGVLGQQSVATLF